ncbi:MAG: dipeptidase, partial [Trueperaceae bacterium]|nr:dipeptidase [Trueperaceae bacterium]
MAEPWENYLETHKNRFTEELFDFIRIPSVSAQKEHSQDVYRAAEWVKARLEAAGLENAQIMDTGGHPVVYADWLHAGENRPTVLIYGHFDVQPAEPLELWHSPPFEPTLRDGLIFARGASDDKGGMFTSIIGAEAILKTEGQFGVNLKFCYEGQEEIGSPTLATFLQAHKEKFACDLIFSSDGLQWSNTESMIVLGLKGLMKLELSVKGPVSDLHSGLHGGVLQNPLEALATILASLRDDHGKIQVEGFFEDVLNPTELERKAIDDIPFDEAAYKAELGIPEFFGEPDFSTRERNWLRPTLDINGIWGGYQGDGSKTVIPSEAHAKITCRLVANQNPE